MTATLDSLLSGATSPGVFVWRGADDRDVLGETHDAGWTAWRLDTTEVADADGLYAAISDQWDLPDWFGRNLDALWDVLAERTEEPSLLVWDGALELAGRDPDLAVVLLGVLRDATTQARSFAVVVRPSGAVSPGTMVGELDGLL